MKVLVFILLLASVCWADRPAVGSGGTAGFPFHERERIQQEFVTKHVQGLAQQRNFAELESLFEAYRLEKLHLQDSSSALALAFEFCEMDLNGYAAWSKKYPKSPNPHIATAFWYCKKAWTARGTNWGSTVSAASGDEFEKCLALGEAECTAAEKLGGSNNPALYAIWVSLGRGLSYAPDKQKGLWRKTVTLDPYFLNVYCEYARGLVPRWGGSKQKLAEMLDASRKLTEPQMGPDGLYAQVILYLMSHLQDIREEVDLDLKRGYRGFDFLHRRNPESYRYQHFHLRLCQWVVEMPEVDRVRAEMRGTYDHGECNQARGVIEAPPTKRK
jgi:hypothetical protein